MKDLPVFDRLVEPVGGRLTDHLWRLADTLRGHAVRDAVTSLAVDAALWFQQSSGIPLPPTIESSQQLASQLPAEVLAVQRDFLATLAESEKWRYLPGLISVIGREKLAEHVATPSLDEVAQAALFARRISPEVPVTIYDPAAGIGASLVAAGRAAIAVGVSPFLLAQEIHQQVALLAEVNFYLAGMQSHIAVGNSLTEDGLESEKADFAVSQAPMGLDWRSSFDAVSNLFDTGTAFHYGLPPRSDATWLFAQRALEKLESRIEGGGRAVVFSSSSPLWESRSSDLRQSMLDHDLLDAVIALPGGILPNTSIPIYALFFDKQKTTNRAGLVRVVDLRSQFENTPRRASARWQLTSSGFELLQRSLRSTKDSQVARTVPVERFQIVRKRVQSTAPGAVEWDVHVPNSESTEKFLAARYNPGEVTNTDSETSSSCRIEVEPLFERDEVARWALKMKWATSRLATVVTAPPVLHPAGRTSLSSTFAVVAVSEDDATPRLGTSGAVLSIAVASGRTDAAFLNGWLSSPLGRESIRAAHRRLGGTAGIVRTDSHSLMQLVAEIVMPVPSLAEQSRIATEDGKLKRVESLVRRTRGDFWEEPIKGQDFVSKFDELLDESPHKWANDLPYPVAAALWTLHTKETVEAKHKQTFLFWEAYAAFTATMLLSALAVDESLRETEMPGLKRALKDVGLSLERATLGTWSVILQRLGSVFRDMLTSKEVDQQERVLRTFGGVSRSSLSRLIAPAVVRLVSEANNKRNAWDGHAGAASQTELQGHLDHMNGLLDDLRAEVGSAWRGLQLVRAGNASKQNGQISQNAELLLGPSTPFRVTRLEVADMLDGERLYLIAPSGDVGLALQPFVIMQPSPASERYTSYFYSRADGEGFRFVSYETAEQSEITLRNPVIRQAIGTTAMQDTLTP